MTASAWTADRIDRLKTLWLDGRTAGQIAAELKNGFTRNAVLGKVHRLGLSKGRSPGPAILVAPRPRPSGRPAGRPGLKSGARSPRPALTPASAVPPVPHRAGVNLLTLRPHHCRWPYGEPGAGLVFCGLPVARGAFCATHAATAYRAPPGGAASLLALAGLA